MNPALEHESALANAAQPASCNGTNLTKPAVLAVTLRE